jgi:hypothetical protein
MTKNINGSHICLQQVKLLETDDYKCRNLPYTVTYSKVAEWSSITYTQISYEK